MKPNLKKAITEIAKTKLSPVATTECPSCHKVGMDTEDSKTLDANILNKQILFQSSRDPEKAKKLVASVGAGKKPVFCPGCSTKAFDKISPESKTPKPPKPPKPPNP